MSGQFHAQVSVVGEANAGKRTLIRTLVYGTQDAPAVQQSANVSKRIGTRVYSINFDTAVENISRSNAILLLVDATNARKEYLTSTVHDLRNHNPSAQIIIVSTKKDLLGDSSTPILDDLKNEANNIDGCSFVSVCCKDVGSTDQLWEKLKDAIDPQPQNPGQKLEVMNIEELKRFWSNYAEFFAKAIATATAAIGHCMLSMMKIDEATNILEVGCGSGLVAKIAHAMMPANCRLTATDLAPGMIQIAKETLKGCHNVDVAEANAEDLNMIADESVDRYYANYVLHLTPDPDKMLREAYRVLKKGGYAGFSVWGRKEHSYRFTIHYQIMQRYNLPIVQQNQRTPFHLSDKEKLIEMVKRAGFRNIFAWYTADSPEDALAKLMAGPPVSTATANYTPEQLTLFTEKLREDITARFAKGDPIDHEVLIVVAMK